MSENEPIDADNRAASDKIVPGYRFSELEFSDGTKVSLSDNNIVAFVGPNNAGKSQVLRELRGVFEGQKLEKVLKQAAFAKTGNFQELQDFLKSNARYTTNSGNDNYFSGLGFQIHEAHLTESHWEGAPQVFTGFFVRQLSAEGRQSLSNPSGAISFVGGRPTEPIQILFSDDEIADRISGYFRQAFGTDLTVFHGGGASWPLMVGERPKRNQNEERMSTGYVERLLE